MEKPTSSQYKAPDSLLVTSMNHVFAWVSGVAYIESGGPTHVPLANL